MSNKVEIPVEALLILISATEIRKAQYQNIANGVGPDISELHECRQSDAQGMVKLLNVALDEAMQAVENIK